MARATSILALSTAAAAALGGCFAASDYRLADTDAGTADSGTSGFRRDADAGAGALADGGFALASGPQPAFGPTRTAAVAPPPISGGTLLVLKDGHTAVAADPDRDNVYVVNLTTSTVTRTIPLAAGDEPGRLVEDAAGLVHVALRSGGAIADVDPKTGLILARRPVCPEPRGIAYDDARDVLHVACAGGELATLAAAGGAPTRTLRLAPDLRDVIVTAGQLYVSRFRAAELMALADDGTITASLKPPPSTTNGSAMQPHVAWRTVKSGSGVVMVHQRARQALPAPTKVYYGSESSGCETSVVESTITSFNGWSKMSVGATLSSVVLPVDIAISQDGRTFAVASAGNGKTPSLAGVVILDAETYGETGTGCTSLDPKAPRSVVTAAPPGQVTAVAFDGQGRIVAQTREPAALHVLTPKLGTKEVTLASIPLSTLSREDTGHAIFHSNSGGFVACASCHAEGRDDGHVWTPSQAGPRRTQSLRGALAGTAPYHWEGDLPDLPTLEHELFEEKMGGARLADDQANALAAWLLAMPASKPSAPVDAASAARGAVLFSSREVGCSSCHNGAKLTNNATVDVGTGVRLQVPSLLGVSWRAPFLHNGCAATLLDRFDSGCGGAQHGHTSQLDSLQIGDLIAYLETL